MSYKVFVFTNGGVVVADGAVAAANLVNSAISGEAVVFVVRTADNVAPAIDIIKNSNDLAQVTSNVMSGNLSANVKEAFASALGLMAAIATLPAGPAGAVAADQATSEAFKNAYDAASAWSRNQDWGRFFDWWDSFNTPALPPTYHPFDLDMYRVPGMPSVVDPTCNRDYTAARGWTLPRDPLVLDLDGDGIETVGINPLAPVLFDHDNDGVRTGTGWIQSDDGLLVIDVNGNGAIDSGRELFGDNSLLYTALDGPVYAADGYAALRAQDSNHDGVVNRLDANFNQLRVWRDLNQDGISQAGELQTLSQAGIASIGVTGTATNVNLGNGNTQIASGSFTRTNGTTGQSGAAELTGSYLLAGNNFYRSFSDNPVSTLAAQSLPQMQGSGWVRDMREAVGLGTPATAVSCASKCRLKKITYCKLNSGSRSLLELRRVKTI